MDELFWLVLDGVSGLIGQIIIISLVIYLVYRGEHDSALSLIIITLVLYLAHKLAPTVVQVFLTPFVVLMIIALLPILFRLAFNIIALPFELLGKYSDYKSRERKKMLEREEQEEQKN